MGLRVWVRKESYSCQKKTNTTQKVDTHWQNINLV